MAYVREVQTQDTPEHGLNAGEPNPEAGEPAQIWDAKLRQAKILLVDDQQGIVEILQRILEHDGFREIRSTTDPLEAIRLFGEFQPDLVVLDLVMPGLSGWKVLAGLRAIMRADAPLPILVVTADRKAETRCEVLRQGASDFVAKPFEPGEILFHVKKLLEVRFRDREKADEAMRESEERFSTAFEYAPIGMALISLDGRLLKVNEMLCGLLGYSEGELLIRTMNDVTHPDDLGLQVDHVRRAKAGEIRFFQIHKSYVHASGRLVQALTKVSLVRTARGQPFYFIVQIQDITEQRRAEESIRMQAQMLDQVGQAVIASDLRGQIIYLNRFAEKLYGWTSAEILGQNVLETLIPPAGRERAAQIIEELQVAESWDGEMVLRRRNGAEFPASITATSLRSVRGETIGLVGISEDITARKQGEAELFQSRETLRSILDQIPQRVFWKDRDSILLGCNRAFASDMGLNDPAEAIGRSDFDATWKGMADLYQNDDRAVMDLDTARFSFEEPSIARDGTSIWVRSSKIPLHDSQGRITGVLGTYEDVTEHKLAKLKIEQLNADLELRVAQRTEALLAATQDAEKANRVKGEFLSRTSHELRTPMSAILGFGQLLASDQNLGPEARESVDNILEAGRQLLALIDQILNISDAESGTTPISLEPLLVAPLIEETLCLVRPLAATIGIQLKHSPSANADWRVLADHRRLKQVLMNLLSNALEFNRPGGQVTLECTARQVAGSPMIRFSIRDTGPGMSAEKFTRLFTPFDRFEDVRPKTPAADRGLRLALSKYLVEVMGGSMGVESVVDEGSTFWVEVALAQSGATYARTGPRAVQGPESGGPGSGTILYIGGDPSSLRLITRILDRRPEISLQSVKTISAALEVPPEVRPNLIVLDLPFAHSGGCQMLERLRADARTAEIPVVILCADQSPQGKALLLGAGARACLTKPVQVRTLLRAIDHFTLGPAPVDSPG